MPSSAAFVGLPLILGAFVLSSNIRIDEQLRIRLAPQEVLVDPLPTSETARITT